MSKFGRRLFQPRLVADPFTKRNMVRIGGIEQLEPRQMMAGDLHVGAVYYENASGDDTGGDTIQVTFEGGAPGTQMTRLVINGDKGPPGPSAGDIFFDTEPGGKGDFHWEPLVIVSNQGFTVKSATVVDGGTQIVFELEGFDIGEKLIFTIDADETQFVDPVTGEMDENAIVEGAEFQRSTFTADFIAPHFYNTSGTGTFFDRFDATFAANAATAGNSLNLPNDAYETGQVLTDRTAGASTLVPQTPLPITISGVVYEDMNANNQQNQGDPGIANVQLALWQWNGNSWVATGKTTSTDSQGAYKFEGIAPGKYRIVEAHPVGYFSVGATAGKVLGNTRGVVVNADMLSEITLLGGEDSVRNDFAEAKPVSISGNVHADLDGDCEIDPGEPMIEGVKIELLDANGNVLKTTFTDKNGNYKFDGLPPGTYGVKEYTPAGYYDGGQDVGSHGGVEADDLLTAIVLTSGQNATDYNFCEKLPASISGNVHADLDGDCLIDPGEPMIEGVKIELLDTTGKVIATTFTDKNGNYKFDNLKPGTYGVKEYTPTGYYDGGQFAGSAGGVVSDDLVTDISLGSGVSATDYNFCEKLPASISGNVHADLDGDCLIDPGEPMIQGVKIELLDANGNVIATTFTDINGNYKFENLKPGVYGVKEYTPAGYYDGGQFAGSAGGVVSDDLITEITLGSNVNATDYNFCEKPPASISGNVHADLDGDCLIDPGEPMIQGVKIELLDANGNVIATTFTDVNGNYKFDNLKPGTYGVKEYTPAGYYDGGQFAGSAGGVVADDLITQVTLGAGVDATDYNFCEKLPASISGNVHADLDGDCLIDPGEPTIQGVKIELLDANGSVVATTFTDVDGNYKFENLKPGEYGVKEYTPTGYYDGGQFAGSEGGVVADDLITEIVLGSGVDATDYNFCEKPPASISGFVFVDGNHNCDFDPNEAPIAGVVITLKDATGNTFTTTTDAQGYYSFTNLKPGVYSVAETQPTGYFNGCTEPGSEGGVEGDDLITEIKLNPGRDGINYNFGETPPATIAGTVFQDGGPILVSPGETPNIPAVRDGQLTSDDKRLVGVILELRNGVTGEVILGSAALPGIYAADQPIRVVTDANGDFLFTGLAAGNYAVFQIQPEGYIDSLDTPGSLGGIAINPSDTIPEFILQQLADGVSHNDDAILRISLAAGQHSVNNWFSEVVTEPERIIIPPPPDPNPITSLPGPPVLPRPVLVMPPPLIQNMTPEERIGGSGPVLGYTWHLSVINAGTPRGQGELVAVTNDAIENNAWNDTNLEESEWSLEGGEGAHRAAARKVIFGMKGGTPITGDFNGDGITDIGVYKDGQWFIDLNGNGVWDEGDLWAKLGTRDDKPVTGDWDGDGKHDIGIYGPAWAGDPKAIRRDGGLPDPDNKYVNMKKNLPPPPEEATHGMRSLKLTAEGKTRADLIDHVFHYGTPTDIPIVGDWNGDGIETIAVFSKGSWYRDLDGDGEWTDEDAIAQYGQAGDKPIVGDFNGDGIAELGVFRDGKFYLDTNGNHKIDSEDLIITMGGPGDSPVVGDWNGDGRDEVGVYHDTGVQRAAMK